MPEQPPLDGVSLVGLIEGKMKSRPRPMGFWDHPTGGISTPSSKWMASLLEAQRAGKDVDDPRRLRPEAGKITRRYPLDSFPGHAAWLDWPWKLHRIESKKSVKWELYNLRQDPMEQRDLVPTETARVESMKTELEEWLRSVVRSLNGEDYLPRA